MLESGIVRLVTGQGRIFGRDLGLDVHSGVGIFFDERPGSTPVQFSILHPLDSAPAFLACLNRLEDARRHVAAVADHATAPPIVSRSARVAATSTASSTTTTP